MKSKIRNALDKFLTTTKKGYDSTYWIIVIIAGAGVITKLFGIGGAAASILAFLFFYINGKLSMRRDKRIKREKAEARRGSR